jgi:hypothetical protein
MTSTAASAPPDVSERSDREIRRWRLHVLRAIALLFVVPQAFSRSNICSTTGPGRFAGALKYAMPALKK